MRLIAIDVTNLTDARYFAARGAHLIGFSAEKSTIEEVNAMKDWVDVPDFFIRLPEDASPDLIYEWTERTGIHTLLIGELDEAVKVHFPKVNWIKFLSHVEEDDDLTAVFILREEFDFYNKMNIPAVDIFVEVENQFDLTRCTEIKARGMLVFGSDEEAVGVKSFDEIDDIIDSVEIEY